MIVGVFATISLLKKLLSDRTLHFDDAAKAELERTVADLERRFFGRVERNGDPVDLSGLGSRWIDRARGVRAG